MKKITLGFSILVATGLFVVGCNKKANVAPEADNESQSSIDVSYANQLVTEIDITASYVAEYRLTDNFFTYGPNPTGNSSNTLTITEFTTAGNYKYVITYNNCVCKDGKRRDGTMTVDYSASNIVGGILFYRLPTFVCNVTLNSYKVDGWLINAVTPFKITNTTPVNFNPSNTKLTWTLDGNFTIKNPLDSSKNMTWVGKLTKTLVNTATTSAVYTNSLSSINWATKTFTSNTGALLEYTGGFSGVTSRTSAYMYSITTPLVKDFTCRPDQVLTGVTSSTVDPRIYSEWHPVINGVASFTTATGKPDAVTNKIEPRVIGYGSIDDVPISSCDNTGKISIKGITYPVTFIK